MGKVCEPMTTSALPLLIRTPFFEGFSEECKKALATAAVAKRLRKKDLLFFEGAKGHSVFVLAEGAVQLFKTTPEGRKVVVKTVEPGELFAEVILFEEDSYPVSAEALTRCLVYAISRLDVHQMLRQEKFRNEFIANLMHKLRYLTRQLVSLSASDVESRFFQFLREHYGQQAEYRMPITKSGLAAAIGTNPETLSRLLLKLRKRHKVTWTGGVLRVPPPVWARADD